MVHIWLGMETWRSVYSCFSSESQLQLIMSFIPNPWRSPVRNCRLPKDCICQCIFLIREVNTFYWWCEHLLLATWTNAYLIELHIVSRMKVLNNPSHNLPSITVRTVSSMNEFPKNDSDIQIEFASIQQERQYLGASTRRKIQKIMS